MNLDPNAAPISKEDMRIVNMALGIAGEGGEVAELAKKQIFHGHGIDLNSWKNELGDVLWYVAACCNLLDLDMEELMENNIRKLQERYPNGFSIEDSKHNK